MKTRHLALGLIGILLFAGLLAAAQKQLPPEGGQPRDFKLPEYKTFTLPNGLGVTLVPYGLLPKASVLFVVRAGAVNEAAGQVWLSDLTVKFLKEGAAGLTSKQIAEEAALLGGEINITAGNDRSILGGSALSEFVPRFIRLLARIVKNPTFPESELARLQAGYLRRLAVQKTLPTALANAAFYRLLYGGHPYGRRFSTEESIRGFTMSAVRKFYEENFGARRLHVYVAGVFDGPAVEAALRESLGDWRPGPEPLINVPQPVSKPAVHVVDRPGSVQSTIFVGLPVIPAGHKDFLGLEVTDALLGGAFFSRITMNIREGKGYTYTPQSQVESRFRDACWNHQADVSTEVTGAALKEILFEIERLGREAPTAAEVKGIQNYCAGIFVLRNSSPDGLIRQLSDLHLNGLGRETMDDYVRNVYRIPAEEIRRLAAELLPRGKMTIVVVGDYEKIKDQVAPFGEVVKVE